MRSMTALVLNAGRFKVRRYSDKSRDFFNSGLGRLYLRSLRCVSDGELDTAFLQTTAAPTGSADGQTDKGPIVRPNLPPPVLWCRHKKRIQPKGLQLA